MPGKLAQIVFPTLSKALCVWGCVYTGKCKDFYFNTSHHRYIVCNVTLNHALSWESKPFGAGGDSYSTVSVSWQTPSKAKATYN